MNTITYNGADRYVHARAHYPVAPEPGTIVGPSDIGEDYVVLGQDGATTLLGLATVPDMAAARAYVLEHGPRSVRERGVRAGATGGTL